MCTALAIMALLKKHSACISFCSPEDPLITLLILPAGAEPELQLELELELVLVRTLKLIACGIFIVGA